MSDIVIVGGGLAGFKTAEALHVGGHRGSITVLGSEQHEPYDRPPLSKQVLRGERDAIFLHQPHVLELPIHLLTGVAATGLDDHAVVLEGGERLSFDHAVIATGAKVKTIPAVPQKAGVFYLRTLDDALSLRAAVGEGTTVVVVGGGFIGCEVAASLRLMGASVTLVEPLEALLVGPLGPELAAEMVETHEQHGVTVRAGVGVSGITGGDHVTGVVISDGTVLAADVVVVGVGVTPDVAWLEGSGVALDDGVLVDAQLRTSVPDVFAAGDVARWDDVALGDRTRAEHWSNATEMAETVAANILGGQAVHSPVPYFWSDQYDVKIQSIGWTAGSDARRVLRAGPKQRRMVLYGRDGALWGVTGLNAAALVRKMNDQVAAHVSLDEAAASLS